MAAFQVGAVELAAAVHIVLLSGEDYTDELSVVEARSERQGVNVRIGQNLHYSRSSYDGIMEAADGVNADLIVVATNDETRLLDLFSDRLMRGLMAKSSKYVLSSH